MTSLHRSWSAGELLPYKRWPNRIYLSTVYRRKLSGDLEDKKKTENPEEDNRYYSMPGEFFVIPYKEIKNINVDYFRLQEMPNT